MKLQYILTIACVLFIGAAALAVTEKKDDFKGILMHQGGKYASDKPATHMIGSSLNKGDVITGYINIDGKTFKIEDLKSPAINSLAVIGDYYVRRTAADTLVVDHKIRSKQ